MDQSKPQVNIGGLRPVDWNRVFDEPASPKEEKPVEGEPSEESIIKAFKDEFRPVIEALKYLKKTEFLDKPNESAGILTRAEQRLASRQNEYKQAKQETSNLVADFVGHNQERLFKVNEAGRGELRRYVNDQFEKAGAEVFSGVKEGPTEQIWQDVQNRILHIIAVPKIAEAINKHRETDIAPGIELKQTPDEAIAANANKVEMIKLQPEPIDAETPLQAPAQPVVPAQEIATTELPQGQQQVTQTEMPQAVPPTDPNTMRANLENRIEEAKESALNPAPETQTAPEIQTGQGSLAEKEAVAAAESTEAIQKVEQDITKQPEPTVMPATTTGESVIQAAPEITTQPPAKEEPKKKKPGFFARLLGIGGEEMDSSEAAQLTQEAQERSSAPAPEEKLVE